MQQAEKQNVAATKRGKPSFFRPTLELLEDRTLLTAVFWTSTQSGFWDVGSNWSTGKVPTASDDVTINQPGVTVTVRDAEAAGTLSGSDALTIASGGSLNIAKASTFGGNVSVSSGGALSASASTTLSGSLNNAGALTAQAGTLTVSGTVSQVSGTSLTGGTWNVDNGATLDLASAASLATNAATVSLSGTGVFTQLASITTDSGSLSLVNGASFSAGGDFTISGSLSDDTGQFSLNNHQLTIGSGGTLSVGNASGLSGESQAADSGTLEYDGTGTLTVSGFELTGGTVKVDSGNLVLSGFNTSTGGSFVVSQGATVDLTGGNIPTYTGTYTGSGGGQVQLNSGGINIGSGGATFDFPKGMFQWTGGKIANSFVVGTLTNTGFLSINDTSSTVTLAAPLVNQGEIDVQGTQGMGVDAALDNQAGAVFNFTSAYGIATGTGSIFSNEGTVKMTGSGTATIDTPFDLNGGTVEADSGNLVLDGGTNTGGSFVVSQGATIQLAHGNQGAPVYTGTYTGSGGGQVQFNSDQINIANGGATFDFPKGMFQWTGGKFQNADSGNDTLTNTGFLSINDTSSTVTLATPLVNQGEIDVQGTQGMGVDAALDNQAGAVFAFNIASAYGIGSGTGSIFSNEGTVKMTGNGTATLTVPVDVNRGTVEVDSGDLVFSGFASLGTVTDGNFVVGPNAVLDLSNYNTTYSGITSTVAAGGTLDLGSGTYSGSFTGAGTVVLGSGGFNRFFVGVGGIFANVGNFDWIAGLINTGAGDFTNLGSMTIDGAAGSENEFEGDGTLFDKGTLIQGGGANLDLHSTNNQFPTTLEIEPGASYLIESDSGVDNVNGGTTAIINQGTIRKTAGSGTSTILVNGALDNSGTIEADSGTLSLAATTIAQLAGNTLTAGAWNARNGSTLDFPSGTNITTNQANLTVDGKGAGISGIGNLASNSGALSLTNGASLTTAGDFSNSGNLVVGAGSTLAVNGGYTQSSTGSLQFQLGGAPTSGQFGQLTATGAASLNGTLQAILTNSYAPSASDSFPVMTFASHTGSFSADQVPLFHGGDLFGVQTNATNVTLAAATAVADLKVTSVSATTASVQTGQNLTVNYTVQNVGNATSATSWVDAVFLSADGKLDSSAILLGRVNQTGPVAANGTYSGTLTAALPFMLPGNYTVIVEADSQGLVPDSNRANNVLAATTPVQVTVPVLPFSPAGGTPTPVNVTLAPSQQMVFQLTVPAPNNILISAGTGTTQFLVGYGAIPTASANIASSQADFLRGVQASLEDAQAGTYYVVVQNKSIANTTTASLTAQAMPFGITNVSPNMIPDLGGDFAGPPFGTELILNGEIFQQPQLLIHGTPQEGNVTITITGNAFTPNTTVSLTGNAGPSSPPATVQAQSVLFKDSHTLFATFTLDQLRTFSFDFRGGVGQIIPLDVQVSDHGQTADFQDGVELEIPLFSDGEEEEMAFGEIPPPGFTANLTTPGAVRVGRPYTVTINYSNNGGINVPAPLLSLSGQGAEFQLPGQSGFTPNSILLFAGNPNGQGGVLPPGFSGSITVTVINSDDVTLQLGTTNSAPIDWTKLESSLQPPGIPAAAWNAIFSNFTAEVGTTPDSLQTALDNDANYLSQLGEYTSDVTQLLAFQVDQAGDFGAIAQRYTSGMFGLGIPDPTVTAVTDSQGNVSILSGNTVRGFALQADGSYLPAPGDFATLTLTGGVYQLRETDGTLKVFNVNGSLNFIEDTNGNKTLYGYTGNQLTSITNTLSGDVTTFTYNAQGFVSQITDPEGRITSLTYDSAGHLLSITDPLGTTSYTYVTAGTPQQLNAVASITNPDGSQVNFTYNSQGQLIAQTQNGGADPLTFSYNVGALTTTDALNDKTTALLDENGQLAEVIDPLGNVSHVGYSSNLQPTSVGLPGGLTATIAHDALGNPISAIDPLGNQTTATFNPTFSKPQTVTDPAGNSLNYSYDSNGNLLGISYPDGSSQQYEYNALGQVTQFTNRNGQAIAYTYYPNGLLKSETLPDGSQDTFTYDNHRNLVSMTDSTGTTAFAYDAADRLTKVTYPNGSFLAYSYNAAGQRTQMTDQTGFTVNYQYDALGRLTKLTDANGNLIVSYTYDDAGRLSSKQFSNGDVTNYTYDAAGDVLSIVNLAPDGKTVQSSYVYTYNNQSLPATMTTSSGTFTYGYDASGQLTSVQTPSGQTITYQYDAAGNRIAVVTNGTTTNYTTNNLNEYTQVGNTTYQYDANGNLISSNNSSGTTTYQYNALGQLVSVASPTGTTTYQYNALGQLVAESVNGTVTNLLVDPTGLGNVVGQFTSSGNPVAQYAYGLGLVSQTTTSGSNNFYSFDLTGNTTQLTGSTGSVLNAYSYLPFGEQFSASGSTPNPFTYVGEFGVLSDTSGLDFMRNRWYDPELGRFTELDPTGLVGGDVNLYRYVGNNPINQSDPTGTTELSLIAINNIVTAAENGVSELTSEDLGYLYNSVISNVQAIPVAIRTGAISAASASYAKSLAVDLTLRIDALKAVARVGGVTLRQAVGSSLSAFGTALTTDVATLSGATIATGVVVAAGGGYLIGTGINHLDHVSDAVTDFLTPFVAVPVQDVLVHGHHATDPNEITGPTGFGTQGFLPANTTLPYRIDFTNEANATAPADVVTVTEQLDPSLDLTTFQLGDLGFGNTIIQVPAGLTSYSTTVNLPSTAPGAGPNGLEVEINASLNHKTGLVTWTFTSIDPTTQDIPIDPSVGFLPPDVTAPEGEGFVSYTIQPKSTITASTPINAQATVVFDQNAPLNTKQISNVLDPVAPTSSVNALPATTTSPTFNVSWSGHDDTGGSGIASYSVFVSVNGGNFTPLLSNTTQTSTTFTGQAGHTYSFFSVAVDNVGNLQPLPTTPQATITVMLPPPPPVAPPPAPSSSPGLSSSQQIFVDLVFVDMLSLLGIASPSDVGAAVIALGYQASPTNPITAGLDILSLLADEILGPQLGLSAADLNQQIAYLQEQRNNL
jgi:RHS repeat-associated protein